MSETNRVDFGFELSEVDPSSTPGFHGSKKDGEKALADEAKELSDQQERLFAASKGGSKRSVLLVLQAMDTAGKGGIVRHVVGQVDPQGTSLHAFKAPTEEERAHDFLWRVERQLPQPGMIGVFDRSHYEDVLIGRVRQLAPAAVIEERYEQIVEFERLVAESGTAIIKVMLHISREEQGERLLERLDRPDKHWKFNPGDIDERQYWDAYMEAYQIALTRTSTEQAPWHVIPANRKWYARLAVQRLLREALKGIDPQWPAADFDVDFEKARLAAS
ncbi:polyphosphate kinase 2 family protein [Amnibacterium flavum]|uniref:Phosphate--nucleotide phosphotransferase n=1 Tax=Amnibacterium flavum TaxID=2173173 RepID=A0A2V1HPU6_9MICO|nr:polyphosphate kinase 2 family protein [Amnibacterium flavum]PVZ94555.1 phosphate--nucleotide phosphotransferase [Amnibacterium flavum]